MIACACTCVCACVCMLTWHAISPCLSMLFAYTHIFRIRHGPLTSSLQSSSCLVAGLMIGWMIHICLMFPGLLVPPMLYRCEGVGLICVWACMCLCAYLVVVSPGCVVWCGTRHLRWLTFQTNTHTHIPQSLEPNEGPMTGNSKLIIHGLNFVKGKTTVKFTDGRNEVCANFTICTS